MNNPRYLLAKFIPDLSRMEPRNVGVLVWSKNGTAARFLAEKALSPGEIDGRSVPAYITNVTNVYTYKQWIQFWRSELSKTIIDPAYGGDSVSVEDSSFLDVLRNSSRGHFILEEGGFLLDELPPSLDAEQFADDIFKTLVDETFTEDTTKDPTLQELSDQALSKAMMKSSPGFSSDYIVECKFGNATDKLKFSHAYQNGKLSLFQKVSFPKRSAALEKNVHSTAWMFEQVVRSAVIDKESGYALVYVTPEQEQEPVVENAIKILDSVASVYNLYSQEEVLIARLKKLKETAIS